MALLENVIMYDTRASQPAATAVAVGTVYYVTDENVTERSNGSTWDDMSDSGAGTDSTARVSAITAIIDGGGSAISTGIAGDLIIPYACTINNVTAVADQSGSIVVDIWKCTYAQFDDSTHPVDADSITASAPVTISTATKSQDTSLTGWTTSISAGDILRFNVDSITSITRVTITLKVTKT